MGRWSERGLPGALLGGPRSLFVYAVPALAVVEAELVAKELMQQFEHEGRKSGPGAWVSGRYRCCKFCNTELDSRTCRAGIFAKTGFEKSPPLSKIRPTRANSPAGTSSRSQNLSQFRVSVMDLLGACR
jgi:hypothetical protein